MDLSPIFKSYLHFHFRIYKILSLINCLILQCSFLIAIQHKRRKINKSGFIVLFSFDSYVLHKTLKSFISIAIRNEYLVIFMYIFEFISDFINIIMMIVSCFNINKISKHFVKHT